MEKRDNRPTVLIVEDDEDDRHFFIYALAQLQSDAIVKAASNGREALELLSALPATELPCIIVLDLNMPVMDGYQTLAALGQQPQYAGIPKVILSTSDLERNKAQCHSLGAADYLVKPSDIQMWEGTARKILDLCN